METLPPIPLLINPKAGSLFRSGLKAWLDDHRADFRVIPTKSAAHLTEKAAELAAAGEPIVAVAGGDGTLMNAAQGLVGTSAAMGILPCGTMNVFAREIGIGSRRFDLALQAMRSHTRQQVDIFAVNGRPFLQMAGFGPDAAIIKRITPKLKKNLGAAAHVVTAVKVAVERHAAITLTLPDGEQIEATQIILGNGKRYGGEAHLFADARYDDGLIDVAAIQMESVGILYEVINYMVQNGATEKNTTDFTKLRQVTSCDITADAKLPYQLDGDYVATLAPGEVAHIEKLPDSLTVCVLDTPVPTTPIGKLLAHPMVIALRERIDAMKGEM